MVDNSKNILQRSLESMHRPFSNFIRAQTTTSWFLFLATVIALWWANSDYAQFYENISHTPIGFFVGNIHLNMSLKHIINDALMVIFFFMLGLEMKREILVGDLAKQENRSMLIICAVGGMLCPAIIYLIFNWLLDSQNGWGIPMATDSAFALGVLMLIRKHIPDSLLAFLVGLAIVDDIGAILVIALFYTQSLSIVHLIIAFSLIFILALGSYAGVRHAMFYIILGIGTWWMMLKSGVHATFAGVLIALTIPARPKIASDRLFDKAKEAVKLMQQKSKPVNVLANRKDHQEVINLRNYAERASTPLRRWEDALELPVNLIILPLFVLTNAGVPFSFSSANASLQHPISLGIIVGLTLGKLIGISGFCWLALRLKIGALPEKINFHHIIGLSLIAGIGFTMSTFIATLAFESQGVMLQTAKSSILVASIISAILGLLYIRCIVPNNLK